MCHFTCDENKFPLGIAPVDVNPPTMIDKNGKLTLYNKRNTSVHEIKNVQKTLDTIPIEIKQYVKVNFGGDKGYISKNKFIVLGQETQIITPKKKNQKTKNSKKEKELLSKRRKVEHFFINLKKNDRVNVRKDKKIRNYMSFVYIALLEHALTFIE